MALTENLCYTLGMDIESAIETLKSAVERANGHAFTHPLKTRDVELALRVLERLASPLRKKTKRLFGQHVIGHRSSVIGHRRDWVAEKYD